MQPFAARTFLLLNAAHIGFSLSTSKVQARGFVVVNKCLIGSPRAPADGFLELSVQVLGGSWVKVI